MQYTAAADVALVGMRMCKRASFSALYHGSNSSLLLKHQNIYFDFFCSIKGYQVRAEGVLEPSLNLLAIRGSKGGVQRYFFCRNE